MPIDNTIDNIYPLAFTYILQQLTARRRCQCRRRHRMSCCPANRSVRACTMPRIWACIRSTCRRIIMDRRRHRMQPLRLLRPLPLPPTTPISWRPRAAACCICTISISMPPPMQRMRRTPITTSRRPSIMAVRHRRRLITMGDRRPRGITVRCRRRRRLVRRLCRRTAATLAHRRPRIGRVHIRRRRPPECHRHWAAARAPSVRPIPIIIISSTNSSRPRIMIPAVSPQLQSDQYFPHTKLYPWLAKKKKKKKSISNFSFCYIR